MLKKINILFFGVEDWTNASKWDKAILLLVATVLGLTVILVIIVKWMFNY